ncbi:hypothetical protein RDI58_007999 [Solanum bulbocastanum]|uniref:Uncharacterized protein n=1 Tax=Solanum bulbocastanum TaxID=147425 RepID=A0AAN8YJR8_SOLBU
MLLYYDNTSSKVGSDFSHTIFCTEDQGDLKEADELFLSRSRGGREDEYALFESIMRKRIIPPISADLVLNQAPKYLLWLLSVKSNYQLGRKKDSIVFESTM